MQQDLRSGGVYGNANGNICNAIAYPPPAHARERQLRQWNFTAVALFWQRRLNAKQFRRLNSPFAMLVFLGADFAFPDCP
jgi:hypothetical protein